MYRFTLENYNEKFLNNDSESITDGLAKAVEQPMKINGLGQTKTSSIQGNGLTITDWDVMFNQHVRIDNNMKGYNSVFFLYFNLGCGQNISINNNAIHLPGNTCNIWSFSGDESTCVDYRKNEKSNVFSVLLNDDKLFELTNRYPDLLSEVYPEYIKGGFNRWYKTDLPIVYQMKQIILQLNNAQIMGRYSSAYIEAKVVEMLVHQLNGTGSQTNKTFKYCKSRGDIDRMHEARNIILQDISTPPTLYELSRRIGVNEKKLKNGFKEVFNTTIYSFILEQRMELAHVLLLETDKAIFEIACLCGYDYASHFTTAFKRKFGVTPQSYRNSA